MVRPLAVSCLLLSVPALGAPAAAQDGYADTTFSSDGLQIIGWSGDDAQPSAVRALGDGSLYVGGDVQGSFGQDLAVTRLTATGALDITWGSFGRRQVAIDAVADASDQLLAFFLRSPAARSSSPASRRSTATTTSSCRRWRS